MLSRTIGSAWRRTARRGCRSACSPMKQGAPKHNSGGGTPKGNSTCPTEAAIGYAPAADTCLRKRNGGHDDTSATHRLLPVEPTGVSSGVLLLAEGQGPLLSQRPMPARLLPSDPCSEARERGDCETVALEYASAGTPRTAVR